jgi:hypothetical protein
MNWGDVALALFRKEAVSLLVVLNVVLVDRTFLRRFETAKILEEHPIAVAIALAAFVLGIAIA